MYGLGLGDTASIVMVYSKVVLPSIRCRSSDTLSIVIHQTEKERVMLFPSLFGELRGGPVDSGAWILCIGKK